MFFFFCVFFSTVQLLLCNWICTTQPRDWTQNNCESSPWSVITISQDKISLYMDSGRTTFYPCKWNKRICFSIHWNLTRLIDIWRRHRRLKHVNNKKDIDISPIVNNDRSRNSDKKMILMKIKKNIHYVNYLKFIIYKLFIINYHNSISIVMTKGSFIQLRIQGLHIVSFYSTSK